MRISDWSSDVCSSDLADRLAADTADRRAHEQRRRRWDRWGNGALAGFALLVPIAGGYGYYLGNGAGEAHGYARDRDETAAASWAHTTNGKLARRRDPASETAGRASCRESGCQQGRITVVAVHLNKK